MAYTKRNPNGQASSANSGPVVLSTEQETILSAIKTDVDKIPASPATSAKQDTGNTSVTSIDTKTPALGQALAAASVPIVLTAAQITTLTPPAAITGYSTSTKQSDGSQKSQIVDGSGNIVSTTSNALDINIKSGNPTSIIANAGTNLNTSNLATSAKQSDGSHKTQVVDGSGNVISSTSNALDVNVKSNVTQASTTSSNNSSTAVLSGGAVFTGGWDDCLAYSEVRITVMASHASATDGLSIQQSSDSVNADITDAYTIAAATGKTFVVPRQARYMRVVYTNGATLQTSFRLQTILNRTGTVASSQRASDAYTNETDLQEIWSFNSIWNSAAWDRIRSIINATNSVGTGIIAAGMVAQFDDVSPTAITENQFGNARMSANRNLYNTIRDAAGNERGVNVNASNQLSVSIDNNPVIGTGANLIGKVTIDQTTLGTTNNVSVSGSTGAGTSALIKDDASFGDGITSGVLTSTARLWNGTNYDRWKGDTTNGAFVNVKTIVPGTGATNLGKAEDAAHTSGDTGVFILSVRNDNLATTYGNDQDYGPVATDANGRTMVAQKAATATLSNVAGSATSVTLLAANSGRIGATITNDSSAVLYVKFGTTASTTSYTVVLAGAAAAPFSYYEVPAGYTGRMDGIWASATGNARVTEIT